MRIKFPPFLISALAAVLVTVIFLSGCGNPPSSPSPSPSSKPLPPLTPPSSPVIDPNAPPAAYRLSNLRAIPSPLDGANVYLFYVDVENTGGQPGNFSATYRIDNDPVKNESKKLNLDPGKKKQLELIGPQQEILILGQAYDEGLTDERQHVVFCGDLKILITLAERPALLLITSGIDAAGGNITVTGDVKNISGEKFDHIIAVADIGFKNGTYQGYEASVVYEPVMPGQMTPFRVVIPSTPAMEANIAVFRVTFNDAAGVSIRSVSGETQ
jgi:hypothetical protein